MTRNPVINRGFLTKNVDYSLFYLKRICPLYVQINIRSNKKRKRLKTKNGTSNQEFRIRRFQE